MSNHPVTQPSADRHSAVTQPSLNRIPPRHSAVEPNRQSAATTSSLSRWLTAQRRFKQGFSARDLSGGIKSFSFDFAAWSSAPTSSLFRACGAGRASWHVVHVKDKANPQHLRSMEP